jgi:hypothetical protein
MLTLAAGEKARENKERSERDARNQEHAGNSYRVPMAGDLDTATDFSGLPWGSVNLNHVVSRGHDAESRRSGSGHGTTYVGDESCSSGAYVTSTYPRSYGQTASYGSGSMGEESYYDQAAYLYDPADFQSYTPR